eukprot:TRINITY_DN7282_c0_g2_i4.p1 TRINITY_DN7282_c0_g2~~TRINITY_DN7282_c0_g2_i4.p1  ORF type:complete len:208 (-),score=37.23 TRINITY_DN7282_c0_g2_i4:52-609(-)
MANNSTFRALFAAHVAYALNIDISRVTLTAVDSFPRWLQITLRLWAGTTPLADVSRDLINSFNSYKSRMMSYPPMGPNMRNYLTVASLWKCVDGRIATVCSGDGAWSAGFEYETPVPAPPLPPVTPTFPASQKSPPIAMIAGIVAGVVGVVATVAGIVWVRRRQAAAASQHEAAPSSNYVQLNPA